MVGDTNDPSIHRDNESYVIITFVGVLQGTEVTITYKLKGSEPYIATSFHRERLSNKHNDISRASLDNMSLGGSVITFAKPIKKTVELTPIYEPDEEQSKQTADNHNSSHAVRICLKRNSPTSKEGKKKEKEEEARKKKSKKFLDITSNAL